MASPRATARAIALAAVATAVAAGCSGRSGAHPATATTPAPAPTTPASALASPSPALPSVGSDRTVWLCRPGDTPDPCSSDRAATAQEADGSYHREPTAPKRATGVDCFYVYPTVSREPAANADLRIQDEEISTAKAQASRFSAVCDVWAPMYRQRTVNGLFAPADSLPGSKPNLLAYASLRAAWRDYLAHDNNGRPVVFIGHSQGAAMLIRLLRGEIDPSPALRAQMRLALLLGGNVTVRDGRRTGGSFQHIPTCASSGERGCVIAYSTFPKEPPTFTFFGRPGGGVSLLAGESAGTDLAVVCVNPARLAGGAAALHPYFPTSSVPSSRADTPWTSYPERYVAQCRSGGGAHWLQVTPAGGSGDVRPTVSEDLGPAWGFHIVDVNLALGDLVDDVAAVSLHG